MNVTDEMVDAATAELRKLDRHINPARIKDALVAALGAMEGAQLEAVVVPCEPTHAMNQRGVDSLRADLDIGRKHQSRSLERAARNCYVTMLSAAPPPPDRVQPERYTPREVLLNLVAAVTAFTADNGPTQCNLLSQAMRDARRALWVQPERVEAVCKGTGTPECHFRMAERIIGDPRVSVGMAATDEIAQNAIPKAAPPSDASGGVTDAMVEAALLAFFGPDCGGHPDEDRSDMRAALEAADRARKPGYRQPTFADAERIKESADGVPPLESETNDMLAALIEHGAVIPEHAPGGAGVKE